MTIRYAICNEVFEEMPIPEQFARAAEYGYAGVEIAPFTLFPAGTETADVRQLPAAAKDEVRQAAQATGLEIVGLHWLLAKTSGFHLTHEDAGVRRETLKYAQALAELCEELGGKIMVWGSPLQRALPVGTSREEGFCRAMDFFQELTPTLEKCGVTVAFEPLAPTETNFINSAAEAVNLIRRVDSENFRLHLDCKAMSGGELDAAGNPVPTADVIRRYAEFLVHFHANDPNLRGPGFGDLDFIPIFEALNAIKYAGWASVEVFDFSPGAEATCKRSLQYMKFCNR